MSRPAPVSRPDPDPAGPGFRAEPTTPSAADRAALVAVWVGPLLGAGALLAAPNPLTVLLVSTSPVLLLAAGAGWMIHTIVLRSRSWVRAAYGHVPRADHVLAWVWAAGWAVPGVVGALAATGPGAGEDFLPVTVVLMLLAVGVVPTATVLAVGRHARARRTALRL